MPLHNCPECGGSGTKECDVCAGSGKMLNENSEEHEEIPCKNCPNSCGYVPCGWCHGTGYVEEVAD
jgi:RecJ-like exonuclease